MSRKNTWIWPASLLGLATLVIGIVAYGVLRREASRLEGISSVSAEEQARTVSENIGLIISEMKLGVIGGLEEFGSPENEAELRVWARENPDLDFAFRWEVETPNEIQIYSREAETRYLRQALKDDRQAWLWNRLEAAQPAAQLGALADMSVAESISTDAIGEAIENDAIANFASSYEQRQIIRSRSEASKQKTLTQFKKESSRGVVESSRWIPTRVGDAYTWIGVVFWDNETVVTGAGFSIELARNAIQSSFPSSRLYGANRYELIDDLGNVFLQTGLRGNPELTSGETDREQPAFYVDLGSELPGWRLGVSVAEQSLFSSMFVVFWAGLAASLLLMVAGAGAWLVWQTRSSQMEAAKQSSFVSNVSHELKTPLTTIRMYSELVREGRLESGEKRNRYLATVVSECERLTRLVNNVLDFSRLREGRRTVEESSVSLISFLEEFAQKIAPGLTNEGMSLDTDFELLEKDAVFDSDGLSQILVNLIDNAVKYAHAGGWIGLSARDQGEFVIVKICDKGPGLPLDRVDALFKPFERGDKSLVSEKSGFGLGLSIARGLATEMGGFLNYRNEAGGACFEIGLKARR